MRYMDTSGNWHDGWPGSKLVNITGNGISGDTTLQWTGTGAFHWQTQC